MAYIIINQTKISRDFSSTESSSWIDVRIIILNDGKYQMTPIFIVHLIWIYNKYI